MSDQNNSLLKREQFHQQIFTLLKEHYDQVIKNHDFNFFTTHQEPDNLFFFIENDESYDDDQKAYYHSYSIKTITDINQEILRLLRGSLLKVVSFYTQTKDEINGINILVEITTEVEKEQKKIERLQGVRCEILPLIYQSSGKFIECLFQGRILLYQFLIKDYWDQVNNGCFNVNEINQFIGDQLVNHFTQFAEIKKMMVIFTDDQEIEFEDKIEEFVKFQTQQVMMELDAKRTELSLIFQHIEIDSMYSDDLFIKHHQIFRQFKDFFRNWKITNISEEKINEETSVKIQKMLLYNFEHNFSEKTYLKKKYSKEKLMKLKFDMEILSISFFANQEIFYDMKKGKFFSILQNEDEFYKIPKISNEFIEALFSTHSYFTTIQFQSHFLMGIFLSDSLQEYIDQLVRVKITSEFLKSVIQSKQFNFFISLFLINRLLKVNSLDEQCKELMDTHLNLFQKPIQEILKERVGITYSQYNYYKIFIQNRFQISQQTTSYIVIEEFFLWILLQQNSRNIGEINNTSKFILEDFKQELLKFLFNHNDQNDLLKYLEDLQNKTCQFYKYYEAFRQNSCPKLYKKKFERIQRIIQWNTFIYYFVITYFHQCCSLIVIQRRSDNYSIIHEFRKQTVYLLDNCQDIENIEVSIQEIRNFVSKALQQGQLSSNIDLMLNKF